MSLSLPKNQLFCIKLCSGVHPGLTSVRLYTNVRVFVNRSTCGAFYFFFSLKIRENNVFSPQ